MSPAPAISAATRDQLDLLRAALLLQVVLGHLIAMILPPVPALATAPIVFRPIALFFKMTTRFGPQAAVVFIVLSGFLVGGPLLRQRFSGATPDFLAFVRRRYARLLPTMACALVLTALLDLSGIHFMGAESIYRTQNYDFVAALTPLRLIGNLLGLQPTAVDVFGSNGPLWTLGYLLQFYVVGFAALCWTRSTATILSVAALVLALSALKGQWLLFFGAWMSGALLVLSPPPHRAGPMLFLGLALMIAANLLSTPYSAPVAAGAGAALISSARAARRSNRNIAAPAKHMAGLSYEIYAVHYPIAFFLFAGFFRTPATAAAPLIAFLALSALAILLGAMLTRNIATLSFRRRLHGEISA